MPDTPRSHADNSPTARRDRAIAAGRTTLALVAVVALWLDPSSPARYAVLTLSLLHAYAAYSLVLAFVAWRAPRALSPAAGLATHVIDLSCFVALMGLSTGSSSPLFVFFTFAIAAATLRWQTRGVAWTATIAAISVTVIGIVQGLFAHDPDFELNRAIVRVAYLVVIGVLLWQLGQFEARRRRDIEALANWPRRTTDGLSSVLAANLQTAASLLGVERVVLVWEDVDEPWIEIAEWDGSDLHTSRGSPETFASITAPELDTVDFYVDDTTAPPVAFVRGAGGAISRWSGVPLHPGITERFEFGKVIACRISGELVTGRVFFSAVGSSSPDDLVLGRIVASRIAGELDIALMERRVTALAVVDERMRLSNELHDGVVQSLTGISLKLQRAEQLVTADPITARTVIGDVQRVVAAEQQEVRFYMLGLRHSNAGRDPVGFEQRLRDVASRIEIVWGVKTTTRVALADVRLSASMVHELTRIAQEAIVNAAKHSGATEVTVDVAHIGHDLCVTVSDNGRGFDFHGNFSDADLHTAQIGPVTLKARTRSIGGTLAIQSSREGCRLDVRVPITPRDERAQ